MLTPTVIQKSAWIHLVNGRVLSTRSKGKETYYFPGGKPERGEAPEETLIREIEEELTVSLVPSSITELGIFEGQAHGKPKGTIVRMSCFTASYTGNIQPAAEIEEVVWLQFSDISLTSPVDQIIFQWLHDRGMLL